MDSRVPVRFVPLINSAPVGGPKIADCGKYCSIRCNQATFCGVCQGECLKIPPDGQGFASPIQPAHVPLYQGHPSNGARRSAMVRRVSRSLGIAITLLLGALLALAP